MRLIIEIETVGDEFFKLNVDWAVKGASAAETGASTFAPLATIASSSFGSRAAIPTGTWTTIAALTLRRPGTSSAASRFVISRPIAFFRTRAAVALRTRLVALLCRLFFDGRFGLNLFDRLRGSLLRLRSFEIFYYRLYFVWHFFSFIPNGRTSLGG